MLTPLQARINIRTLRANREITEAEFDNLDNMLTSSDRENHSVALGIIEFKKEERIKKQLHFVTGSVDVDIMNVDIQWLVEVTQAISADRDKIFAMYLPLLTNLTDKEREGLLELLDSKDQESTYLGEQIIINKIRELQNSKCTSDNSNIS